MKRNSSARMKMLHGIGCFLHLFDHAKKISDAPNLRKILLIRTHALGDVLLATPAIRAVRRQFPDAVLSILISEGAKSVVLNNPNIDRIISFPDSLLVKPEPLTLLRLVTKLRKEKYDCVISLSRSAPVHFLAFLTGSPLRVGLDFNGSGFPLSLKVPDKKSNVAYSEQYAVRDYLDIVAALGVNERGEDIDFYLHPKGVDIVNKFLNQLGVSSDDLLIGIFPGGGKNIAETIEAKRWPVVNYAKLADLLIRELGAKVLLLGGKKDVEAVSEMQYNMEEKAINACNIGDLNTFGHLLKYCSLLITNDSLPLHLGLSLKIPVIALFGPTNAKALTPSNYEKLITIQSTLECSPCYWKERFPGCKRYSSPKCMNAISVSEVLYATKKILKNVSGIEYVNY
jgi:lipopolysaccharide heptosyltransferase II